jgi:hypothetical protein
MGGLPSGAGKHLVERFPLSEDRRHLRYAVTVDDPEYLEASIVYALPCDLEAARKFLSDE